MTEPATNPPARTREYLYHQDRLFSLYLGNAAQVLATLPAESVDCVVTSPPFWGHRDYGTGIWTGGDPTCHHQPARHHGGSCPCCGATWCDPQHGLEATLDEYLDHLLGVFDQLHRVLRPEGTCWLNLGDTYSATNRTGYDTRSGITAGRDLPRQRRAHPLPGKNLLGIPWRAALALQSHGWWLRQAVIWHKPNAMPESVRDRPSSNYEHLFLLTRSPRYYFDLDAIRVPPTRPETASAAGGETSGQPATGAAAGRPTAKYTTDPAAVHGRVSRSNLLATGTAHTSAHPHGRNPGSIWSIPTRPSKLPHFATFPIDLPLRCIAAGSPPGGIVLDPFAGTSTTGLAAVQLGRTYIGVDINPAYHDLAVQRLGNAAGQYPAAGNQQRGKERR